LKILKSLENLYSNHNKTINNSIWLVFDKVIMMLLGVIVTAVIARYFGPEKYGLFNYALSFVALFTSLSTLGLDTLTIKSIVQKEHDENTILFTSFVMRIIGGLLLSIIAITIINILEPNDRILHTLVIILSSSMIFKASEVIEYWVQAYQNSKMSSLIRTTAYIISTVLKIILVIFQKGIIYYGLIYLIESLVIGIGLTYVYYKNKKSSLKPIFDSRYALNILKQSWYLVLAGLMGTLYMKVDQVMLGSMMRNKGELGVYSVAVQLANLWYFIPMALITSFKPIILGKRKESHKSYINIVQIQYSIIAWIGIIFGIIITLSSDVFVLILYGDEYINASGILSVSVWAGTFAMLGTARGTWLVSEGLQKFSMYYIGFGAILNITLNLLLIPNLGGYGAAIATLASQVSVALIFPLIFKETRITVLMMIKAFTFKR
jgi:O-antigen/teichoic acid export membrane protein